MARHVLGLAGFLLLCIIAASTGSLAGPDEWYQNLTKPPLTPPGWLFGVAWSILYTCIAVSAWLVWKKKHPAGRSALQWWLIQLLTNALWSPVFFGAHRPDLSLVIIVTLLVVLVITIRAFVAIDRLAGWLLIPYLGWISFATYLNCGFWFLNR